MSEVHADSAGQGAEQGIPGVQERKDLIFEVDEEALRHRPQCGPQTKKPRAVLAVGGRRSSQRLSAEAKHIRSGDWKSSASDTSGMLTAWMTVLLMIGDGVKTHGRVSCKHPLKPSPGNQLLALS